MGACIEAIKKPFSAEDAPEQKKVYRGMILKTDLEKIGFTMGCPGCDSYVKKISKQQHSDACRVRVIREMERLGMPGVERLRDGERRRSAHCKEGMAGVNNSVGDAAHA